MHDDDLWGPPEPWLGLADPDDDGDADDPADADQTDLWQDDGDPVAAGGES